MTQLEKARHNILSTEIKKAAKKENISPRLLLKEVASGRAVLPANVNHKKLVPIGIGRNLRVKVNINLGNSPQASCRDEEVIKAKRAISLGADTIMDLSTGPAADVIRRKVINVSTVPVGTVPIYEALKKAGSISRLSPALLIETIHKQAEDGVGFMTLHAGVLRKHIKYAGKRVCGIVSRGGSIIAGWMSAKNRENPLYEHFEKILKILRKYDVTASLGDGLRPGALADASDRAQFAELGVLGELVKVCRKNGVQVMVEGPGHVPINQIEMNVKKALKVCHDAPFYVLGPLVTDIALGYDHINAAIGAAIAARSGAAFLCGVTPSEHLSIPNLEDIQEGLVAFKIAAHAWDTARNMSDRDLAMSIARRTFDWKKQVELSIFPEMAGRKISEKDNKSSDDFCSMCGKEFCAMRNFKSVMNADMAEITNKNNSRQN